LYATPWRAPPPGTSISTPPLGTARPATPATAGSIAATSTTAAAANNNNAARNVSINAIGNRGKGSVSSGAAVSTAPERMIPLAAIAHYNAGNAPLSVSHQGLFVASTISFNLQPGASLGQASNEIIDAINKIRMPTTIYGNLAGSAQIFQQAVNNEPILIAAAIAAVYILLGVLYESYIHPITILSTLPSAGVGA